MALRDFIKTKVDSDDIAERVVQQFNSNVEKYADKSLAWKIRITAEDLGIKKDTVLRILDEHYGSDDKE